MTDKVAVQGEEPNATPEDGTNATSGVSGGKRSHKEHKKKVPLFDTRGFQWVVAIMLVLITVALSAAMIVLVWRAGQDGGGNQWDTAFFTVLIGLFGVLITGLFVFMAFRIDRGARWEAQQVAEEVAKEAARGAAEEAHSAVLKAARKAARKRAGKVAAEEAGKVAVEKAGKVAAEEAEKVAAEKAEKVAAEKAEKATERKFVELAAALRKNRAAAGR